MRKLAITGFGITLFFILLLALFFFFNFHTVIVTGPSMEDTFHNGDRLLACRAYWLVGELRQKDVVVIRNEDSKDNIIKRICYMEGEEVDYMNVPESWSLAKGPYVVPKNSVFVLGDNYAVSEDSRKFGAVDKKRILGKIILLPPSWVTRLGIVGAIVVGLVLVGMLGSFLFSRRRRTVNA